LTVDVLLSSELDPGLEEAISTVMWVAPRLSADVQELREVFIVMYAVVNHNSFFIVWAAMIVWRMTRRIIRTVLCCVILKSWVDWTT